MLPGEVGPLFAAAGYRLRGGECRVMTYGGRSQRIWVEVAEPCLLRLWALVARGAQARAAGVDHGQCWERNRLSELVGLRLGSRGELIAEAFLPTAGLTQETVELVLRHIAVVSDRWEHQFTGEDSN